MDPMELEKKRMALFKSASEIPGLAPKPAMTVSPLDPFGPEVPVAAPTPQVITPHKEWSMLRAETLPMVSLKRCVSPSLKTSDLALVLEKYGLTGAMVEGTLEGPTVTTYMVRIPTGARVKSLGDRSLDLSRDLGLESLRVLDQVPGYRGCIGVEVPNESRGSVSFKDTLHALQLQGSKALLPVVVGATATGRPMSLDLSTMPHLLVSGTTGSGKSVFLHSVACSIMSMRSPKHVHFHFVDPKRVEFQSYRDVAASYVYSQEGALRQLGYMVDIMEERYAAFEHQGVSNIQDLWDAGEEIPYEVMIIDEYADLVMAGKKGGEVESLVIRLAQKARAAGIHMVIATQKPTADVISTQVKANMPSRIAFRVSSGTDSKVILDEPGAEGLLGQGDMFLKTEVGIQRLQGAWLDKATIKQIVASFKA